MTSITLEQTLLQMLSGDSDSPMAIAIGCAAGTRTKDGAKTSNWSGEAADKQQIEKLKTELLPQFIKVANRAGWLENKSKILFAIACDVFVQSEPAAEIFLDQIFQHREFVVDQQWLIEWRCKGYVNPATKKLDAPGFANNLRRLRVDQSRRTLAILGAIA